MMNMLFKKPLLFCLLLGIGTTSKALTLDEFRQACHSIEIDCKAHPALNAYVGGALDLVAVLDEQTNYLDRIYCRSPKDLFNVGNIIDYLIQTDTDSPEKNAMLFVVKYLESNGGCEDITGSRKSDKHD